MKIKTILLTIAGFLFLTIGIIGIVIPVLPTTPFVVLSLGCFSGIPKLKNFILKNKFISDHYYNYKERKGLKKFNVIISLIFLWTMLGISIYFIENLWLKLLLCGIGIAVTAHIIYMAKPKKIVDSRKNEDDKKNTTI